MNDRDDRRAEVNSRHSSSGSTRTPVPDSSSNSSELTELINKSTSGEPEVSAESDATGTGTDAETSTAVEVEICPTCHQEVPKNNDTSASPAAAPAAPAVATAAASPGAPKKRKVNHTANECEPRAPKRRACVDRSKPRARLTLGQKLEILDLLDQKKMSRVEIAAIYKCSDRTVSSCSVNRTILEAEAASSTRKLKSKGRRSAGFPEVDRRVLSLIKAFESSQIPVGRTTIASFGHAVKASLLAADATPAEDKKKLEKFGASEKWVKNLVSRNGLVSRPLLLADGSVVDSGRVQARMKEVQKEYKQYNLANISFYDGGVVPKRSYLSCSEAENLELAEDNDDNNLDI
ncbi:unnamed protein product [Ectocarpus sp. CCAP 1310/34]|nr:unnamed protein product [Ectocarpus sp. CCAP 1310/34]